MDCPYSKKPCDDKKILHITELNNEGYTEFHMCEKCANQYSGNSINPEIKFLSTLKDLIGFLTLSLLMSKTISSQKQPKLITSQCPNCGVTPEYISKNGRFGCAKCYEYYQSSVEHLLKKCQEGATEHIGKVPKSFIKKQENKESLLEISDQIINLEHKMQKAIMLENYEIAGVLKQKIQELRQQIPKN